MKSIKLSDVPFILQVYQPSQSDLENFMDENSFFLADREDEDTQFEKDLELYFSFAGYYLGDKFSVEKMGLNPLTLSRVLSFKKISERAAHNFGVHRANKISFSLAGSLALPKNPENLEELIQQKKAILTLNRASGLANLQDISGQEIPTIQTALTKVSVPNFMHPYSFEGFGINYSLRGSGLRFFQENSFLRGESAKYLPREK
jgi:hypothetical protein